MQTFPTDLLNEIRKHLEAEKKSISERIRELTAQDPFSDPDRLIDNAANDTEANEESSHDRFSAMIEELKRKLTDIDNSLMRISEGKYGFCSSCNQMIDTDRLSVLPAATLCLDCETKKKSSLQK
jgi:DnaK suppressor protein